MANPGPNKPGPGAFLPKPATLSFLFFLSFSFLGLAQWKPRPLGLVYSGAGSAPGSGADPAAQTRLGLCSRHCSRPLAESSCAGFFFYFIQTYIPTCIYTYIDKFESFLIFSINNTLIHYHMYLI